MPKEEANNRYSGNLIQLDSMSYFWQLVHMKYARKAGHIAVVSHTEGKLEKIYIKRYRDKQPDD